MRFATQQEIDNWDELVASNPNGGNVLQGKVFLEQKARAGWSIRYIMHETYAIGALEKTIPLLGTFWYIPKGPCVSSTDELDEIITALVPFARKHGVFTVKTEPELDHTTDMSALMGNHPLVKSNIVQYNYATVLVDLSPSLDDIMKSLNQKGRHAIRRAERDGVTVKQVPATDENCQIMYNLFTETASGAGFAIRPAEYYCHFYNAYGDDGQLFFAYVDDKVVAGAFAMILGKKSMYKDGASVRERTAYGASHLLQWHVIQWAKSKGSCEHDLAGVPPIAEIKNPEHPFYGLGRFKTSFNKTVTEYVGAYDIAISPWKTKLWNKFVQKLIRKAYFKMRGESWY